MSQSRFREGVLDLGPRLRKVVPALEVQRHDEPIGEVSVTDGLILPQVV